MKLSLTPQELRELTIDEYVLIGHLLTMPDGNDLFVPKRVDPYGVASAHGISHAEITCVYARKDDL